MKLGFIDYYLDEWHANHYPEWLREASGGELTVTLAYGQIDSPLPGGRTTAQWCRDMGIARAATLEELIEGCDALVVLSPDNCEQHEALCRLPLQSGKPTYVDKTFAPDGDTARRIFALAEASHTPCCSTSALRYAHEFTCMRRATAISSWGPGGFETYSIHQLEPMIMLMGGTVRRVMALPEEDCTRVLLAYDGGRYATLACYPGGSPFMMNLRCAGENRVITVESDYFGAFIHRLVRFFRTREELVSHAETIAVMDVRAACLRALAAPGTWADVRTEPKEQACS